MRKHEPGRFALFFALSAGLGFAVNLASFVVIQRTSSVLLKTLGTARNAGLVLFSVCLSLYYIPDAIARGHIVHIRQYVWLSL